MDKLYKHLIDAKNEIVGGLVLFFIVTLINAISELSLLINLLIAAIALWLFCLFLYLRRKKVYNNKRDKRKKSKGFSTVFYYSSRIRQGGLFIIVAIPLLIIIPWGYFRYQQSLPPEKFIVLVADFDGPDPERYRVTETVINRLRQSLSKYEDVEVESLGKSISEQEGGIIARKEGEKRKASIVIWGWYGATPESVPLNVGFVILCPLKCAPPLRPEVQGEMQTFPITQLDSFTLQTQLSNEMTLLSLLAIGLYEYSDDNWDAALSSFSDAISLGENQISVSHGYFYRGLTHWHLKKLDMAFNDMTEAIKIDPNYSEAYSIRSTLQLIYGDPKQAIQDASQAIHTNPNNARYYDNRGTLYLFFGNYELAGMDFNQAVILDPTDPSYIRNRGIIYYWNNQYELAMSDLNQSIALYKKKKFSDLDPVTKQIETENFARAYVYRATLYYHNKNYSNALVDFNKAIDLYPEYANAFHGRAALYLNMGKRDRAIEDLQMAISLSDEPKRRQQMESELEKLLSE